MKTHPDGDVPVARGGQVHHHRLPVRLVRRRLSHSLEVSPSLRPTVSRPVGADDVFHVDVILGVKATRCEQTRSPARLAGRHARALASTTHAARRLSLSLLLLLLLRRRRRR